MSDFPPELTERFTQWELLRSHLGVSTWRARGESESVIVKVSEGQWTILPFIEGVTLRERLENGPLNPFELGILARSLAEQLAVRSHGDLKPANIIWNDRPALIDYADSPGDEQVSTLRYLSPEGAGLIRTPVTPASDLFSLGVVLYESATGHHPFPALELRDWLHQLSTHEPPPPGLGPWDSIIARLLQKQPESRYASALELLSDLEENSIGKLASVKSWTRLSDPSFVGREDELARLREIWESAQRQCRVVAVSGEPGVGKSALLNQFRSQCSCPGWQSPGGALLPWEPLLPVVEAAIENARLDSGFLHQIQRDLAGFDSVLVQLFPKLRSLWPHEVTAINAGPHEVQLALRSFLTALGPGPIFLEDAHWVSESMQELLLSMHLEPPDRGLMLVCTYRPREASPHLMDLPSIELQPLKGLDLGRLFASMAAGLPAAVLDKIQADARGNPFLSISQLRGAVECGALTLEASGWKLIGEEWNVDRKASKILESRLQSLAPMARQWLTAGAVLGRRFCPQLATSMAGYNGFEDCTSVQLVHRAGAFCQFQHDLIRESLLGSLSEKDLVKCHRLAASVTPPEDIFAQARHLGGSKQVELALAPALEAASQAVKRQDLDLAEDLLRIAEEGWEYARTDQRFAISRTWSYLHLCKFRVEPAVFHARRALEFTSSPFERAQALRELAETCGNHEFDAEAFEYLQEAHQLLCGHRIGGWRLFIALLRGLPSLLSLEKALDRMNTLPRATGLDEELMHIRVWAGSYGFLYMKPQLMLWAVITGLAMIKRLRPGPESWYFWGFIIGAIAPITGKGMVARRLYSHVRSEMYSIPNNRRRARALGAGAQALWLTGSLREGLKDLLASQRAVMKYGERYDREAMQVHLGCTLYCLGRFREAQNESRPYADVSPFNEQSLAFVNNLSHLGASEVPDRILEIKSNPVGASLANSARGLSLWRQGRFEEAATFFERASRLNARHICLFCLPWKAECYRRAFEVRGVGPAAARLLKHTFKAARRAVSMIHYLPISGPHAYRELGQAHRLSGEWLPAEKFFRRSLALAIEYEMPFERALTHLALSQLDLIDSSVHRDLGYSLLAQLGVEHPFEQSSILRPKLALADRFSLLLEEGRKISQSNVPGELWPRLRNFVQDSLRPEELAVLDATGQILTGDDLPYSRKLLEQARSSQKIVFRDENVDMNESLYLTQICSTVYAPIVSHGQVRGILVANHRGLRNFFGSEELRILEYVCSAAGSAFDNHLARSTVEAAFQSASIGIAVVDKCGGILQANQSFSEGIQTRPFWSCISSPSPHQFRQMWRKVVKEGIGFTREVLWRECSGQVRQVVLCATRIAETDHGILTVTDVSSERINALMTFQEAERQMLAAELHDDLVQVLACLNLKTYDDISTSSLVQHAVDSTRQLINRLRSPILERKKLRSAILNCISQECLTINCNLQLDRGIRKCQGPVAHGVYRIVQEALVNIRKHSQARNLSLTLKVRKNLVKGRITDDGVGINARQVTGYGLISMRQRALLLGGEFRVRRHQSGGTEIRFILPL